MTIFKCKQLLTKNGWLSDRYIRTSSDGLIVSVSEKEDEHAQVLNGYVIPGFQNGHSHAFQYAMAGLAEHLPADAKSDDFWSWREAMYNLALKLTPDQFEAIATMLYCEMLRNGFTHVVEFHYLHNDMNGKRYADSAEMAKRLINAAAFSGIELTLVPMFYHHGGFGKPAVAKQRRFLSESVASYLRLQEASRAACRSALDATCGIGVHSLRAGSRDQMKDILTSMTTGPFHIHIAEQQQEIDDCVTFYGKRPVEWMLDEFAVDQRYSFTHATHMTETETKQLAESGATTIICPSTEGNLGDGFFNLISYRQHGGSYTIGTDSHIGLSAIEELRWLDYVQRLRQQKRNVICQDPPEDSAVTLVTETWRGGRGARGEVRTDPFEPGKPFDCVVIDSEHPVMIGKPVARALGAFIYGGDCTAISKVIRRGKTIVEKGMHAQYPKALTNYHKAITNLE